MRQSKLLKASRFGDILRSTLSWWRSAMISASREARDLKSPMTTHQISFSISPMRRSIARFAALRQWDKVYDKDSGVRSLESVQCGANLIDHSRVRQIRNGKDDPTVLFSLYGPYRVRSCGAPCVPPRWDRGAPHCS